MAIVYSEEFKTRLQERLSEPTIWKEICNVEYTDKNTIHNPAKTAATLQTGTRGSAYVTTPVATVDSYVEITNYIYAAEHIDRADLAQKTFSDWMEIADDMATTLDEGLETAMLAAHAQWTDFDNSAIGGSAGNITVSESNIDDIIRAVKREIREAKGKKLMARNGVFFVWRDADFEKLEALAQAQGYNTADGALKDGTSQGFRYMGAEHYSSALLAPGHCFAGVKKVFHLGICKSTYGKFNEIENPVISDSGGTGQLSGLGLESRIDYAYKAWSNTASLLFDILVA